MKSKFDKALSVVALSVLGAIGSVHAAPVYEIVNIEDFDLKGTVDGTRSGYAMAVNANNELVGVSKGKKKLSVDDDEDDNDVIDVEDGIAPEETIIYSVFLPLVANNFTFTAEENDAESAWYPNFYSVNGTTAPTDVDDEGELIINSVDTFFYGMNDNNYKVGSYTAPEKTIDYVGSDEDQEFWYYRDFELRGVAVTPDGEELELVPSYETYIREDDGFEVELGGWSAAAAINDNNLVAGYASTDIIEFSSDRIDSCIDADLDADEDSPAPVEICVQADQFPANGRRNIQYQTRAHVWQIADDNTIPAENVIELELGLTPDEDSTLVYTAQALGVNNNDVVVGRSHVYRNGKTDDLYQDAAYWVKNAAGEYEYQWIDTDIFSDDVYNSIARDINDNGIVIGTFYKYVSGILRDKFFYYDINNPSAEIVVPSDFQDSGISELSSYPKAINNAGQVVGNIEVTYDKDKPRPKAGFLYNIGDDEFVNLNATLTCESKGYEQDADGKWTRYPVEVIDGDGSILSYDSEIYVVEANDINEDGTIVGTAFIRKPLYQFDTDGNLILDEDTNLPLFEINGNGDPVTSYLPRMVVMKPVSGNEQACTESDDVEDEPYVRKGAASFAWLFALPLLWLRRRKLK
ncbi:MULTISPECIES: DUF3466 family protein [unclassified Shewanella]|uniref:DUF3466 family protein n=1 Tax=unclassified Shewanella TaxID=196818 RepID=UPI000C814D2E|nr:MULTISPECIES: DUF3466 family protein [unclassified Shewanella]MDO6620549.1 DUF3466 family protein [Shewanella sp. 6_MG-2023]PMH87390.1 hypothetical protein BCU57_06990 [Shewanella sp. 10N.286.48.B5]